MSYLGMPSLLHSQSCLPAEISVLQSKTHHTWIFLWNYVEWTSDSVLNLDLPFQHTYELDDQPPVQIVMMQQMHHLVCVLCVCVREGGRDVSVA